MKCSKCGYRASDIAHLAAHYRKKHPGAMKHRSKRSPKRHLDAKADESLIYRVLKRERLI